MNHIMRRRSVEATLAASDEPQRRLTRTLGAWDLVILGISVVIGAGIFSKAAQVSATRTGPSVIISFVIAGIVCAMAALCYAEFASHMPVAGSAYTFSYASMGEFIAWIIGWDLILEMFFAAAVVAKAWGLYFDRFLALVGLGGTDATGQATGIHNTVSIGGVVFDWGTAALFVVLAIVLASGSKLSARFTGVLTYVKVGIVLVIIVVGFTLFDAANLTPFVPTSASFGDAHASGGLLTQTLFSTLSGAELSVGAVMGILAGAGTVFFAFIGFDVVATAAEETKNPQRNVPLGILGGLAVCTALYIAVSLALSGMATPEELRAATPDNGASATIITAFQVNGTTPAWLTALITIVLIVVTCFFPVDILGNMVNIGTLSAFVPVSLGVPFLRRQRARAGITEGGFTVPFGNVLPYVSAALCLWLMMQLDVETWLRFAVWLVIGVAIYFGFGYWNSQLRRHPEQIARSEVDALQETAGLR